MSTYMMGYAYNKRSINAYLPEGTYQFLPTSCGISMYSYPGTRKHFQLASIVFSIDCVFARNEVAMETQWKYSIELCARR